MARAFALVAVALSVLGTAPAARADDAPTVIVVFESPRGVDAARLRRAFTDAGVRAVGVADEAAVGARDTLTIVFERDDRTATAWLRGPRGASQRQLVSSRRDRSGRWVVGPAAAFVRSVLRPEAVVATVTSEVLDPWAPRATGRDTTVHRVPMVEVLDPWADTPRRTRRTSVIYPIVSPEVIDPWRAPDPEPTTAEVLDPWRESGARLAPPRR
ncbi:MAG: hypothetical protein H6721_33155 [Sandaracinus sp.]|nr:hypothetical protein [Sandaracinus sp.]MCB9623225.1 hypothetical protein [Sandaracinus sp.]MCB9633710.1 hypothetical protein [Sandaracinus sp.]MCB9636982.1 hypothetical protein [Sandaracinus sp.]